MSEEKKEIKGRLKKAKDLFVLSSSEGGKLLRNSCKSDIVSSIYTIVYGYQELPHAQLIAQCARLKERLDLYMVLSNSELNKKSLEQELENILKEDPDLPEE